MHHQTALAQHSHNCLQFKKIFFQISAKGVYQIIEFLEFHFDNFDFQTLFSHAWRFKAQPISLLFIIIIYCRKCFGRFFAPLAIVIYFWFLFTAVMPLLLPDRKWAVMIMRTKGKRITAMRNIMSSQQSFHAKSHRRSKSETSRKKSLTVLKGFNK